MKRHDGEYRWVVNRGVPMFAGDNSFVGYIGSCTDITVRKEIENVREELLLRERQARAEAEAANRAKDEFLAVISHELRAPLNAMYGWARILQTKREQVDAATLSHAIDIIERSARTQSKLIEDLIDTTRIRTGKLRLDMKPVDLANLVQAAVDIARPSAKEKRITLAAVINTKAGIITGDPERLQQIIGNLLSNAIKFTPEGGHVSVRLERNDPNAQIFVTDTGIGISSDMLPHIFDRFYQVDRSSTTRGHGGLGLGLSLAQQLTELHGGTIQAVSAGKEQGTTFIINLPLRALRGGTGNTGPLNTSTLLDLDVKVSLEGVRVLCVDDERDARELVATLLERFGANVTATSSAAEALKALRGEGSFDVIVSDISMPGEDGYSLIRKIRALPTEEGARIPAIALTAFSRLEDRERTREEGYNEHVAKPVEPMRLVHTIHELAQPRRKAKARDADV
jgi:signal transduction histidine kinase/CheY-like chemotaxis protein